MKAAESGVGLVSCACWDRHATLKWKKSGFFMFAFLTFLLLGIFVPYIITVIKNLMPALLPFISQSGGAPPNNGIFAIFFEIGVFFGFYAIGLLAITIHQRNVKNHKFITDINRICYILMLLAGSGLVFTVCFPVGYTDVPNKFQWLTTVLYGHSIGASFIIAGSASFQFLITYIWWYLPDTTTSEKYTKLAFCFSYFLLFLITVYPLIVYLLEQLGPDPFDFAYMKTITYSLPLKYSLAYQICSVSEWLVCLMLIGFLYLHCKDLQKVSVSVVFRHKSCLEEEIESVPSISLKVIS